MIGLVLRKAVDEYKSNFKVAISFLLLLVFVFLFVFLEDFFLTSGTILLNYEFSFTTIVGLVVGVVFLYFYSLFVSLTVYSVQRDVQKVDFDAYWNQLMKGAAFRIFFTYLALTIVFFAISLASIYFGLGIGFALLINFVISALVMYAPQSIVLDNTSPKEAAVESAHFFVNNLGVSAAIIVVGSLILAIIYIIEFALGSVALPGNFISIILVLVVVVPFIEQMKSYAFVLKFELIGKAEIHQSRLKIKKKEKIQATRLHETHKGGKL